MPQTPNKGLEIQTTGSNVGTWGDVLNDDMISPVDLMLGGVANVSLSSTNVPLTAEQSQAVILRLSGVLLASVIVTTECLGFFFVENATTGNFTVTIRNSSISTSTTAPQGSRVTVISDASNGCRIAGTGDFPTGTRMSFQQASAPTGWTKDTTTAYMDAAVRLNTTSGSGGTTAFSTVMTARTIAANQLPNITISIADPGHDHVYVRYQQLAVTDGGSTFTQTMRTPGSESTGGAFTGITASINNASRGGVAQQTMDFAVKYVDFILAAKN
jgi:hypothetical protein